MVIAVTAGTATAGPDQPPIVNPQTIIDLVFERNPEIIAARYAEEEAKFQFLDFERNLSQFTPFISDSGLTRSDRSPTEDQEYRSTIGMRKEYFDSSSFSAGVGNRGGFGDSGSANSQLAEADITLPLFSSNTKLRRITDRSREENLRLNTRLEYIDTVRDSIQAAQESYFWLLVTLRRLKFMTACQADYRALLDDGLIRDNPADCNHLSTECESLEADIIRTRERIAVQFADLRLIIGFEELQISQLQQINLHADNFFGKSYLTAQTENLMRKAEKNDIRVKVLQNARHNSIEKRDLAIKGTWDAFLDLGGEVDFAGTGTMREDNGYSLNSGLRADKIDSKLLQYSKQRATAEIRQYNALIKQQELRTRAAIEENLLVANSRRNQYQSLLLETASKEQVYQQKRASYLAGNSTLEDVVMARSQLMWAQINTGRALGEFYESASELDHACGVYFEKLEIEF